jgi:demethylmenaquinone methyltransferase/2-methoxy-6-polyprenyl-1,4-benzoquinol methylase
MALPAQDDKVGHVRDMFDRIAPRYDLVNRIMTFGLDTRWRRRSTTLLDLPARSTVLDIACGTGDFCRDLARAGHQPIGVDLSLGMLKSARTEAPLAQADTFSLPVRDGSIDAITCGFALRNFASIPPALDEFARVLRPGGRVGLLEVAEPSNALLRFGHGFYFGKVVPRIGGLLSDKDAYRYLPESVTYLPEANEVCSMMSAAGFDSVTHTMMFTGAAQLFTAANS